MWCSLLHVCTYWISDGASALGTFTHLLFSCSVQRGKRLLLKFLRETLQQELMWTRGWSDGCSWVKVLIQNDFAICWNLKIEIFCYYYYYLLFAETCWLKNCWGFFYCNHHSSQLNSAWDVPVHFKEIILFHNIYKTKYVVCGISRRCQEVAVEVAYISMVIIHHGNAVQSLLCHRFSVIVEETVFYRLIFNWRYTSAWKTVGHSGGSRKTC